MKRIISQPGGMPSGAFDVPGDKSVSHRALLLAARAGGETTISGFLDGADCRATADALAMLGVEVRINGEHVQVRRDTDFVSPSAPLDLGNSGTGIRLLAGLLCGLDVDATLTGDASLRSRPMQRIAEPLHRMGAMIETADNGCAPLRIRGRAMLTGIDYRLPVASAQVKSAVLLAGLSANEVVTVHEPGPSRDHTERMLRAFGANIETSEGVVRLAPRTRLRSPGQVVVPGDLSSAAFLFAAAASRPGAAITVRNVGINPTRAGFLDLLSRMGAKVSLANPREQSGEPVADVSVEGAPLTGIRVGARDVALSIDEIPILLALGAVAEGETVVEGAAELRVKESDRLAAMADGLGALGIVHELQADGIRVFGGKPQGGRVDSRGDHRIAMAFAVLGQAASAAVTVEDCENIATSFPCFAELMQSAGLNIRMESA